MFDPHRTRRSDRRYYTRKGQVIQASRVNVNPTIDQRLVPIYKNYILKNNLLTAPSPPAPTPPSTPKIKPIGIAVEQNISNHYNFYSFEFFQLNTEETFNIELTATSSSPQAILLIQQKKNGDFVFVTAPYSYTWTYNVTDNVKCYYRTVDITNTDDYKWYAKGLYHTSPSIENIFIYYDPTATTASDQNLYITSNVNIEL